MRKIKIAIFFIIEKYGLIRLTINQINRLTLNTIV